MDRRTKATLHRNEGDRLNHAWGVGAVQSRYSEDGHWYATLSRFPAALFDAHGYLSFSAKDEYQASTHFRVGRQISVPKPGISAIPGYVRITDLDASPTADVDIHTMVATEGRRRLILHLQRERNRTVVRNKKKRAKALDCEVCGFSFRRAYGDAAGDYCEVHHLLPLSEADDMTKTRMEDLAILCANCHRVVHLLNPPYTLDQVRALLFT